MNDSTSNITLFDDTAGGMLQVTDQDDLIEEVSHRIENLTADDAMVCMMRCIEARGFNAFALGGALAVINENGWYKNYGFPSFKAMVGEALGISTSSAYDYMNIYINLVNSGVAWDAIHHIGWTKIRLFAGYLTKDNVSAWIAHAGKMNAEELREYARGQAKETIEISLSPKYAGETLKVSTHVDTQSQSKEQVDDEPEPSHKVIMVEEQAALKMKRYKRFQLYPDQEVIVVDALNKAKKEGETDYDSVALMYICMAYLRGEFKPIIIKSESSQVGSCAGSTPAQCPCCTP